MQPPTLPRKESEPPSFGFDSSRQAEIAGLSLPFHFDFLGGDCDGFPVGLNMTPPPAGLDGPPLPGKEFESSLLRSELGGIPNPSSVRVNDVPPPIPNHFSHAPCDDHPVADAKVPSLEQARELVSTPHMEILPVPTLVPFPDAPNARRDDPLAKPHSKGKKAAGHGGTAQHASELFPSMPTTSGAASTHDAGAGGYYPCPAPAARPGLFSTSSLPITSTSASGPHDATLPNSMLAGVPPLTAAPPSGGVLPFAPAPKVVMEVVKPEAKAVPGEGRNVTLGKTTHASEEDAVLTDEDSDKNDASEGKTHPLHRDKRRLERNAREQRRSKKITNQIDELKELLRCAGRPVKANKASILAETADYIQDLQKKRCRLEQAARSSAGGGADEVMAAEEVQASTHSEPVTPASGATRPVTEVSYRYAFHDSGVPMAIATMDGCIVEANRRFMEVSQYPKGELLKLTIFNLTAPSDLQWTFSRVSQMLRSTEDSPAFVTNAVMKHNKERGSLSISLVRDDLRRPVYFCVCLIHRSSQITPNPTAGPTVSGGGGGGSNAAATAAAMPTALPPTHAGWPQQAVVVPAVSGNAGTTPTFSMYRPGRTLGVSTYPVADPTGHHGGAISGQPPGQPSGPATAATPHVYYQHHSGAVMSYSHPPPHTQQGHQHPQQPQQQPYGQPSAQSSQPR